MKKQHLLGLLIAACLLYGCGSSDSFEFTDLGLPPTEHVLSGRVVGESGDAIAGVRLIANERTTDAKFETTSGTDGRYQVQLPTGVYDIGLDLPGDTQTSTCFYGPVNVDRGQQSDLVLRQSGGQPDAFVSGRLWLTPGVPAASRRVVLRSGHLPGPETSPTVETVTDLDGSFSLLLSSEEELGVDLEFFDAQGDFDQFIDFGKLSKPVYLEFMTDLPVARNQVRSDEGQESPSAGAEVLAQQNTFTLFSTLQSIVDPGAPQFGRYLLFRDGVLPVDKQNRNFFTEIVTPAVNTEFQQYKDLVVDSGQIRVDSNGSWWWKYAVNIKADGRSYWQFEDETGDAYSLSIILTSRWHKVSYNSSKPNIVGLAQPYTQP